MAFCNMVNLLLVSFVLSLCSHYATASTVENQPSDRGHSGEHTTVVRNSYSEGAVYTRWGKKTCPKGAALVYSGFIGGIASTLQGGGSDYLCMTEKPESGIYPNHPHNYISGAEYVGGDHVFGKKVKNHNAVCAVCRSKRTAQVMIPGTRSCVAGWTEEYHGYLMTSGRDTVSSKNYVCVDQSPEGNEAGSAAQGGATLMPVCALCGALPCPKYVAYEAITCVVCSQY